MQLCAIVDVAFTGNKDEAETILLHKGIRTTHLMTVHDCNALAEHDAAKGRQEVQEYRHHDADWHRLHRCVVNFNSIREIPHAYSVIVTSRDHNHLGWKQAGA